ncbi:MAG: mechanosensitive ion channel family protein [Kofleriaceae bacterium]|nr:mechanosensitive ion channel family protein [Myxococcales bacterium]MCB9559895.1 mechanosensitive ion channel family protein [Kofleriaceae bacterium]MCB9571509.1 mechanosensitive ion channel family protein [Kofleriaceae bacterium]
MTIATLTTVATTTVAVELPTWIDEPLDRLRAWAPDLIAAVLTLAAFYLLWRIVSRGLTLTFRGIHLDPTAASFLQLLARYAIMIGGGVTALARVGVDVGALLASLGIVGLSLGFAARDSLSNLISGLFIFWDRPFVIGDLIEVGGFYGRVAQITLRSTRVVTPDGKMLAVPNTMVVNSIVASYSNFPHLRLDVRLTIGTGEDLTRVRRLLLDLIARDDAYLQEPAPVVVVTAVHDYNVEIELQAWLADEKQHIPARLELRERMYECLRRAQVEMPLETLALRVATTDAAPPSRSAAGAA